MRFSNQPGDWLRRHPFRIYLIAVGLAVVPLTFFLLSAHKLLLEQSTTTLVTQAGRSGQLIGMQVERHLHERTLFLETLALRPDLRDEWEAGHYERLTAPLQEVHALRPEIASLGMYDVNGTLRTISPPAAEPLGKSFADRDWYQGVTKDWKPYVSAAYSSGDGPQHQLVAVAVPLRDKTGKPLAILVVRETLDEVTRVVYGTTTDVNRGLIFFVDQRGQVFGVRNGHVQLLPELQPLREAISSTTQTRSKRMTLRGRDFVVASAPIPSLQWGVLIQVPSSVIREALWRYEKGLGILGLLIIALALGSGAVVAYVLQKMRQREDRYLTQIETQNRALELRRREAEHANQMKSRFLSTMSHELRTPLNAILGFAGLLQDEPALAETQKRWMTHIYEGGQHLLKLVNDVLDLARIESGRIDLHREIFWADLAVPEIIATLAPLTAAKQITVNVQVQRELRIDADKVRFKQILYNLLSNAVKFTPAQGKVWLRGYRDGTDAVFEVQDTGVGIRPDDQQRVFEEFSRLQEDAEGTGLGLAITRRLVQQHGGDLRLESEFGRGSTFRFALPLARDSANDAVAVAGGMNAKGELQ